MLGLKIQIAAATWFGALLWLHSQGYHGAVVDICLVLCLLFSIIGVVAETW